MDIDTITREELAAKLDSGDDFKLVMTLNEFAFNAAHIPGSINIFALDMIHTHLDPSDEIVVYCSDPACPASIEAYNILKSLGFENVRRYSGGLSDWEAAGLPLEGSGHL